MADTLPNTPVEAGIWLEIYDISNIPPGTRIDVQNVGANTLHYSVSPTQPDNDTDKFRVLTQASMLSLSSKDLAVWIFSPHGDGLINVARFSFAAPSPFPSEYFTEVSRGNIPGERIITVSGKNPFINDVISDVWEIGGQITHIVQPGIQVELNSRDPADTFDGIGAQEVTVFYLDNNWIERTESIETNGGVKVLLATNVFRFLRMVVTRTGSFLGSVGDIDIRPEGGLSDCLDAIIIPTNSSKSTFFTVPINHDGFIISVFASTSKGADAKVGLFTTNGDNNIFVLGAEIDLYQQFTNIPLDTFIDLTEKSDIKMTAINEGNGNTVVSAGYRIWLVERS